MAGLVRSSGALVLIRHGQSAGNAGGIFTGLLDVPLSPVGRDEAIRAAALLDAAGIEPDTLICSPLLRARQTARLLSQHLVRRPTEQLVDWQLAERNYGALTGCSKSSVVDRHGWDRFVSWRRSVDDAPPAMSRGDASRLYRGRLDGITEAHLGRTESLRDVVARVAACWRELIRPRLERGLTVAVVAHGNSLRALCTVLDRLSDDEIRDLNLPTGHPLVYHLDPSGRPTPRGGTYLDPKGAAAAAVLIAHEGGT